MNNRVIVFLAFLVFCISAAGFGQEPAEAKDPLVIFLPAGYDFIRLDEQTLHSPAGGVGFMFGEQDLPFTQVDRRFFGAALYQTYIFTESMPHGIPKQFHQISAIFDGRLERHQLLFIFQSASDKPLSGLNTVQAGAGWGYEVIRRPQVSLILGAALCVSDFGITLPSGDPWPVLPLPIIRFGIDTHWFASSLDFITSPNLEFTIAPKEKIRLTGGMEMHRYRSIADINCEYTLWYRLFSAEHKLGDFAGIGIGFKNETAVFALSVDVKADTFELRQSSIFAVIDLSILQIRAGWVFDSEYIVDDKKAGDPGKGFYISIQGMIPVTRR
jgi:hypothetical protein